MSARAAVLLLFAITGCRTPALVGRFSPNAFYHSGAHYRVRYEADHRLLPAEWQLANFEHDTEGAPTVAVRMPQYWNAPIRRPRLGMERFDLHFVNSSNHAEIFVRSIADAFDETPIRTLLYSGSIDLPGRPVGRAVWIQYEGRAIVDGRAGYAMTFETAAAANAPAERISVVGVRTHRLNHRGSTNALVLFGYATSPELHDAVRPAFEQLVRRVDLRRDR